MTQIEKLASQYNIKVVFIDESKKYEDFQERNHSWSMGSDEIWLGLYDDPELQFISFFHELGHCLLTREFVEKWNYSTLPIEIECWNIGLEEARKNDILFSDEAIKWGYEQAISYAGHDERELIERAWLERKTKLWRYRDGC